MKLRSNVVEIRMATEADAQLLAELGSSTFEETFSKDNRREDMELYTTKTFSAEKQLKEIIDPNRRIAIAWIGNNAAGFVHLLKGDSDLSVKGANPIEILRLYVSVRWHGQGVGAALMDRSIQIARDEGFQTLWLGVWERNFKAQSFYRKYGFVTVGQHVFRLGTDDQIDLIMSRAI
jgi:diamine N-acetyltransferase